ncbi:MAG TPA: hypothetical protein ENJ00_00230 [Phycisphaerales bacterium]|nr:hypothetical protein [Phycisphaerales bacterium]
MNARKLEWAGLTLILWSVLTRASVNAEPLPGWDADPTQVVVTILGLGPTGSLMLDLAAWLGTLLVLTGVRKQRQKISLLIPLALLGGVAVWLRTALLDWHDVEAVRIASSWSAAWAGFAGIAIATRRESVRRLVAATLIGFVMFFITKAAIQIFVEHPATVELFNSDKRAILIGQGIDPGSPQALIYERRLQQPNPTGWFGLSNVLAAFLAMGTIALAIAGAGVRGAGRWAIWFAALLTAATLILTGSKAGLGVAGLALGVWFILTRIRRIPPRAVIIAAVAVPPAALIARGLSGWPAGELSLLFRWFYAQTAARISIANWLTGVGPTGFRDAYMIAKPPASPEDVISPHLVWLDYTATLGLAALPWIIALAAIIWLLSTPAATRSKPISYPTPTRAARPWIILWVLVPVLVGAWLESPATTIEASLGRLLGVGLWVGLSVLLLMFRQPGRTPMALGCLALLAHAELDMVMSLPTAAPLALVMLAAVGNRGNRSVGPIGYAVAILGLIFTASALPGMATWEHALRTASAELRPIAEMNQAVQQQSPIPPPRILSPRERIKLERRALNTLTDATRRMPADPRSASASARLALTIADESTRLGNPDPAIEALDTALATLELSDARRASASTKNLIGAVTLTKADILEASALNDDVRELRARGIEAWEQVVALSPNAYQAPARLAEFFASHNDPEKARRWAEEALRRDTLTDLDPLSSMPESRKKRLEQIVRHP